MLNKQHQYISWRPRTWTYRSAADTFTSASVSERLYCQSWNVISGPTHRQTTIILLTHFWQQRTSSIRNWTYMADFILSDLYNDKFNRVHLFVLLLFLYSVPFWEVEKTYTACTVKHQEQADNWSETFSKQSTLQRCHSRMRQLSANVAGWLCAI